MSQEPQEQGLDNKALGADEADVAGKDSTNPIGQVLSNPEVEEALGEVEADAEGTLSEVVDDLQQFGHDAAETVQSAVADGDYGASLGELGDEAKTLVHDVAEDLKEGAGDVVDTVKEEVGEFLGGSDDDADEAAKRAQYDATAKLAAAGGDNPDGHAANQ